MINKKEIEIIVDENGHCSIDAIGFSGNTCETFMKEIEQMLGISTKREKKPEYRQTRRVRRVERNMG